MITHLYSYHTSYFETNINSDLVKINDWANTWLIKFNPNMFFFLISNTLPCNNINMYCENSLDYIENHRRLGITFIENCKWVCHICWSDSKEISVFRKLNIILNRNAWVRLIKPTMGYECREWNGWCVDLTD